MTRTKKFLKDLFDEWGAQRPARLAASLAYYSMFSLVPMIFIAISVAEFFLGELASAEELYLRVEDVLGSDIAQFLEELVVGLSETTSGSSTLVTLISFLALVFAASGLFTQLKFSLNEIWEAPTPVQSGIMGFIKTRLLAFILVIGVGLLLVLIATVSIIISMIASFLEISSPVAIGQIIIILLITTLSFALLYKILPDVHVSWRDVWIGAAISSVIMYIASLLVGLYFSYSDLGSAWGAAGALAVLLITVYYFSQIFLLGAVFTKVYAFDFGSKSGSKGENTETKDETPKDD
jgi:membrane protein